MFWFVGLTSVVAGGASPEGSRLAASAQQAWAVLARDEAEAKDWEQIHAAEVLIALGHGARVRERMQAEREGRERGKSRIGVWRVLARTAVDAAERRRWVREIEAVFADRTAPDRAQAIETLAKLKEAGSPETQRLAREWVDSASVVERFVARWFLVEAHDLPGEALFELLRSNEANSRRLGAYALARVGVSEPGRLREVANVTDAEADDSVAAPYLLAAALTLGADPDRTGWWRERLLRLAATAPANAQLEAARAMVAWMSAPDADRWVPQLSAPEVDARIGAAWVILQAHGRDR